jgi:hypothetical protein
MYVAWTVLHEGYRTHTTNKTKINDVALPILLSTTRRATPAPPATARRDTAMASGTVNHNGIPP